MIKIIHCADLHLSVEEQDYSLPVLHEIIDTANEEEADYLILAGDTFDSFEQLIKLQKYFKDKISNLKKSCEVFLLAGNHEDRGRNNRKIADCDLGIADENIID